MAGRPHKVLQVADVKVYIQGGYSKCQIAELLNVSRPTLNRFLRDSNIDHLLDKVEMSDNEVDDVTAAVKVRCPHMGERGVLGYFKSKG